jgi:hypothetical protein
MEILFVVIVAALVFGVCFLIDKGFTRLFRSQAEHASGKAVRLSKRYGSIGLIIAVVGLGALFTGLQNGWLLVAGGAVMVLLGLGLVIYYMSYGVFYDTDTFLFMTLGKKNVTYRYADITAQQLYNNQGHMLIELHMADGKVVQLQSTMNGCYAFMDHAFAAWCRQTGKTQEDCPFYNPENSCWFPPVEG